MYIHYIPPQISTANTILYFLLQHYHFRALIIFLTIYLILLVYGWFGWGLIISWLSKMGLMCSSSDLWSLGSQVLTHDASCSIEMKNDNLFWRINPSLLLLSLKKVLESFCTLLIYSIFISSSMAISIKTLNTRSSAFQCKVDAE